MQNNKIYVPQKANKLKTSILIMSHCGKAGHRSQQITQSRVQEYFTWPGLTNDIKTFCSRCLHCVANKGSIRVPRPMSHTLHADKPNEIIHFDYLFIGEGENDFKYILIIKDDFSNYVWLIPTKKCDGESAAKDITDWIAAFGAPSLWVSDQGSHFKNQLMTAIAQSLNIRHHQTNAYHPQSNGSVEVVCREVLRAFKALLSEFALGFASWPRIAKPVQMILIQSPSPKLGKDIAPITAFTQQLPEHPLTYLLKVEGKQTTVSTLSMAKACQLMEHEKVQSAMQQMHRTITNNSKKRRQKAVDLHNSRTNVQKINFCEGDYVLIGCPQPNKKSHKLTVTWSGPARVVGFASPSVARVEDLLNNKVREIHVSRLKFYTNESLEVDEELTAYIQEQQASLYLVDEFKAIAKRRRVLEVLVSWVGFPGEDTWESLAVLQKDVPARLDDWLRPLAETDPQAKLALAKIT